MNDEPTAPLPPEDPGSAGAGGDADGPRRLTRSRDERVIAGVCGGIARYFGIDPVITRIAAFGLVFLGGVGIVLYLAAWILVPDESAEPAAAGDGPSGRSRVALIAGTVLGVIAALILTDELFWWPGFVAGPLLLVALVGAAVWWVVRGRRGAAVGAAAGRVLMVVAVLLLSVVAVGAGFWAAGIGGGVAVAGLVVVAGLGIMAAAFAGGARWLIAPAIALALGAGVATAADVDLRGDVGERTEVPRSLADLPAEYDMAAGSLIVDLRGLEFPAGERRLGIEMGLGEAVVVVPEALCVVPDARVGMGEMEILGRDREGVDLRRRDTAVGEGPRLVIDAELGMGSLRITTDPSEAERHDWDDDDWYDERDDRDRRAEAARANAACIAGTTG